MQINTPTIIHTIRRETESTARARYVSGGRGEDRQQYEELPKEGDGQKEKMDGTRVKNTMIIVCLYNKVSVSYLPTYILVCLRVCANYSFLDITFSEIMLVNHNA